MPRQLDPELTVTCPECGKVFQTTRQRIRQATLTGKSFCSNVCAGRYKAKHGLNKPPKRKAKPENTLHLTCQQCGKPVTRSAGRHKERGTYGPFCNHVCYGEWRSEHLAGENSPEWKGGYSLDYGGSKWKSQRRKARARDNHTCQDCGITEQAWGYQLDVHHIVPYDTFDDPKEANDLANLITLCRNCHTQRHKEVLPNTLVRR